MLKKVFIFTLTLAFGASTSFAQRNASPRRWDATIAGEFVHGLPLGTEVKLRLESGERVRGLLVAARETEVVIRPRTRIPEPLREVPLAAIVDADIVRETNVGKAVAAGVAAGSATALGILFALFASLD